MKILAVILFISALAFVAYGAFIFISGMKGTKHKASGGWMIIMGVLSAVCGGIALSNKPEALLLVGAGAMLINAIRCFSDDEGDEEIGTKKEKI